MMIRPTPDESGEGKAGLSIPRTSSRKHGCGHETPAGASVVTHEDLEDERVGDRTQDPSLRCGRSVNSSSQRESADACVDPISPLIQRSNDPPDQENEVMGVDDQEEEVEEGRVPKTRTFPDSMSPEELRAHSLTHIPYHPGCKCCVAGRKRDHQHPRRDIGQNRMHADLEAANGASICCLLYTSDAADE